MATEIEMKLRVLDEGVDVTERLKACLFEKAIDCHFQSNKLVNIYFDTPAWDLNAHKIALRIRDKGGDYIQTLKTKGQSVAGLSQRGEWEWCVPVPALDQSLLRACEAWPAGIEIDALVAVFETNFTRYQCEFAWEGMRIELAFDEGNIISRGRLEKIREIELELKSGNENHLHSLTAYIQQHISLAPSDISKAERGYRLFGL